MNNSYHQEDPAIDTLTTRDPAGNESAETKHCIGCGVEITDPDTPHCGH